MLSASQKPLPSCTFAGGELDGAFTEEQRKYRIKMRWRICERCGLHRREHHADAVGNAGGVGEDHEHEHHLPPRKRLVLRRGWVKEEQLEEREISSADAIITKGKRAPRKKLLW
ncbi:hypothetical protein E2562_002604 [Oryza meyeriana var. granulata]|uniref:Uncharacterized protein n=1 Tax=Oryza meyeriana var. granulata TaxID=110450 RepID=A0A6G1F2X3_9ORYZ|nr:hypothetical protein E2562_002604 [Oryza meyeriana var. granulata]